MKIKYEGNGQRIDSFLGDFVDELTRSKAQELIKNDKVLVNGEIVKQKYNLKLGDLIEYTIEYKEKGPVTPWERPDLLEIIHETDDYLIINKPSGLMVHPGAGNQEETLINVLAGRNIQTSNVDEERPGIVHRLDKDTTGVMVIAKNDKFHNYIVNEFETRNVNKVYLGLVEGNLNNKAGMIDAPIGRDPQIRTKMTVTSKNSKEGITTFKLIDRFEMYDLVEFNLLTGRTHQIRVHAKYIGNPIYNDPIYGDKKDQDNGSFGQYLHSYQIEFTDMEGNEVSYKAPLPKIFENKLKEIKV